MHSLYREAIHMISPGQIYTNKDGTEYRKVVSAQSVNGRLQDYAEVEARECDKAGIVYNKKILVYKTTKSFRSKFGILVTPGSLQLQ
jgi:hypothetical protein